jgi:hypothetical protein
MVSEAQKRATMKWRENHPEEYNAYIREYRERNREKINEYQRNHRLRQKKFWGEFWENAHRTQGTHAPAKGEYGE